MTVNLMNVISRVRSDLNEPAYPTSPNSSSVSGPFPKFYTDTEITNWVNDAMNDVARRAEELITFDQSIDIPAYNPALPINNDVGAIPYYPLLDDVVRIQRIEFVPINQTNQIYKLEPSMPNEMDQVWGTYQQSQSSYPRFWVTHGYPGGVGRNLFTLQIYPNPSQAGMLNIFYYRLPGTIGDPVADPTQYDVTIDMPNGWDEMIVIFATYRAMQKQRTPEWNSRKAEYEERVAQIIDVTRKYHDQQSYVSYGTNYLPSWLTGGGEW